MKTWKKIVRLLILVALILPAAALVAIQIPAVQTAIVGKATGILNQDIDGEIFVKADGDDYTLTAQDKSDIANLVIQILPTAQGVSF